MKLWTVLGSGHLNNTISLHQAKLGADSKVKSVSDFLVEILSGETTSED